MDIDFSEPLLLENISDKTDRLLITYLVTVDHVQVWIPREFVTDYASVPHIPFVYELFGGIGKRAALVHDYLYSSVCAPCLREHGRVWADVFFREALRAHGTSWYKRTLMYGAIRIVGWYFFQPLTLVPPTPPAPPLEGSAAYPGVYIPSDIAIKGVRSDGTNYDI